MTLGIAIQEHKSKHGKLPLNVKRRNVLVLVPKRGVN